MKKTRLRETLPRIPKLRFSPMAWAKLLYLRDVGNTEIGGFGVTRPADALFVENLVLVSQLCTAVYVAFDDSSVADYFDRMVDEERGPENFARIWVHTHPGNSAQPSGTDERTFARVFGHSDWAVMFILARGGQTFARLRYNIGPGADIDMPVEVDFAHPFAASDEGAWQAEYTDKVQPSPVSEPPKLTPQRGTILNAEEEEIFSDWNEPWNDLFYEEPPYGFDRDFG
jgi:proteasome lid subunit RPN8/RPN11